MESGNTLIVLVGRYSAVVLATRFGLDGPGIESCGGSGNGNVDGSGPDR